MNDENTGGSKMQDTRRVLWDQFEQSGRVMDYLQFRSEETAKEQGAYKDEQQSQGYNGQWNDTFSHVSG